MPATALRCRICETAYDLDPIGVCAKCFGPLDPVYDRAEQRRTVSRESIEAGPQSIWRYADLLPVAPPEDVRLPVGWTPLINVPRLADATESDRALLGKLLLVASDLANKLDLSSGYRVVINSGPDAGESVPHLHVHLLAKRALAWPPG